MYIPEKLMNKFEGHKQWLLFLYLLFKADKKGRVNTSYREMQSETGFSARCIHTAIKGMSLLGAISVNTNRRRNKGGTKAEQSSTIITICNYVFYTTANIGSGTEVERKRNVFDYSFVESGLKEPFEEWIKYKRVKRQMYKRQQDIESCYRKLKKYSGGNTEKAMQIVTQSMSNNWDGLFELKANSGSIVLKSKDMNYNKDTDW